MNLRERVIAPSLSFNFSGMVIVAGLGSSLFRRAECDRLVSTAVHDVLGEIGCCYSRDACCGALSHQALRAVAAYLPVSLRKMPRLSTQLFPATDCLVRRSLTKLVLVGKFLHTLAFDLAELYVTDMSMSRSRVLAAIFSALAFPTGPGLWA